VTADRFRRLQDIAGPVSRETYGTLVTFEKEFLRWCARINLAAPSTLESLWERHVLDSAQLLPLASGAERWLDLGSGGGFPGAVVAILLRDVPGGRIDLIESNSKKASFLQTTLGQLGAPALVHRSRIEKVEIEQPSIVTARALAPLPDLLDLSSPWLLKGAQGLFHKGRGYHREVEESRDVWRFDMIEHPSAISPDSMILRITGLQKR
jgi:16S rRNA (guanine527-N7)-methyltransferase